MAERFSSLVGRVFDVVENEDGLRLHHCGRPGGAAAQLGQVRLVTVNARAAFLVGWAQQHAAARHINGTMIAQQTTLPAPHRW